MFKTALPALSRRREATGPELQVHGAVVPQIINMIVIVIIIISSSSSSSSIVCFAYWY